MPKSKVESKSESWFLKKKDTRKAEEVAESTKNEYDLSQTDCALIIFGRQLLVQFNLNHDDFNSFEKEIQSEKKCGKNAPESKRSYKIKEDNSPSKGSEQLTMELFKEPLWNYARVIGIKAKSCADVIYFCNALQSKILFYMEKIENFTELDKFQSFKKVVKQFDLKKYDQKLQNFSQAYQKKPIEKKMDSLKEFNNTILDHIKTDYTDNCSLNADNSESCEEVINFCDALRKIVFSYMEKIENLTELYEFKSLQALVRKFETFYQLHEFAYKFKEKSLIGKMKAAWLFLEKLDQIKADYSETKSLLCSGEISFTKKQMIFEFGQFLYKTLKVHYEPTMNYDEKHQMLTFPLSIAKHILHRLSAFIESHLSKVYRIQEEVDFVKTVQSVFAPGESEMKCEKPQKYIGIGRNVALFKLLFSWAIHLCTQIEQNDDIVEKKIFQSFIFGLCICQIYRGKNDSAFKYKIKIEGEMVEMNLPNWNLPYDAYLDNDNELIAKKEKENFDISLVSNYWLEFYGIREILEKHDEIRDLYSSYKSPGKDIKFLGSLTEQYLSSSNKVMRMIEIHYKLRHDNLWVYPSKESLQFLIPLSAYSPTNSDVFKMAKILNEMTDDGHIWINESDPKILHFIVKYFKKSEEEITKRTEFVLKGKSCILINFVMDLLKEIPEYMYEESIAKNLKAFIKKSGKLCKDKDLEEENIKLFGESKMDLGKIVMLKKGE